MRTKKTQLAYEAYLKTVPFKYCHFCKKKSILKTFKNWILLNNSFPYDNIAKTHHLLAPIRHTNILDWKEDAELKDILRTIKYYYDYDYQQVNFKNSRSVPNHYHLHLIKLK